mgnify:CR=1 FL=1
MRRIAIIGAGSIGCLLAALTYFPLFHALTGAANPRLAAAVAESPVTVYADPADCHFQFDPVGKTVFNSSCDIAKTHLAKAGVTYVNEAAPAGTVAQVRIGGRQRYAMRIWLDRDQLAARGMTVGDVESALRSENVELPAGRIESAERDFTLRVERNYVEPSDFATIPLGKGTDGYVVRLGDVAKIELDSSERRAYYRSNGEPGIGLGIVKTSTANSLDVARTARAEAERVALTLPKGTQIFVAFDNTTFIEAAVDRVYATLVEAMILVLAVIWLFLGSFRAALIPAVTVPVCLVAAFIALYAFDFSINLLTLLALVLCIGLVVDDAIVVVENVQRRIDLGEPPLVASKRGTAQVAFAVIAMTLTLAAVYAPIGFMQGTTGKLFTEFAWTLAGSVLVSGFVALTLTPMITAHFGGTGPERPPGRLARGFERFRAPDVARREVERFVEAGRVLFRDVAPRFGLRDALKAAERGYTIPTPMLSTDVSSAMRIDFILVNGGIAVDKGWVVRGPEADVASDHYPVAADFRLALPGAPGVSGASEEERP